MITKRFEMIASQKMPDIKRETLNSPKMEWLWINTHAVWNSYPWLHEWFDSRNPWLHEWFKIFLYPTGISDEEREKKRAFLRSENLGEMWSFFDDDVEKNDVETRKGAYVEMVWTLLRLDPVRFEYLLD